MKIIIPIAIFFLLFVSVLNSTVLEQNQFKEKLDTYSHTKINELSESQKLLKNDCECGIFNMAHGLSDQLQSDTILVDSCATVFDIIQIDSCNGNLFWEIGISLDQVSDCRTSPILDRDDSVHCDRWFEIEKSIRIKSVNFDSSTAGVQFRLNEDYFPKEYYGVYTKDDIYPEYPEFKAYITSLENQFDIYQKYRGYDHSITFYFEDYVNLHDFLEAAFNTDYVSSIFLEFFQIPTTVEKEVYNSEFSAYYSNGILEVNSNSEVLKNIQIFDLYGNKMSSINSLNTQNYNINTNLSSGVYFVLVNDKQIIKLSITE